MHWVAYSAYKRTELTSVGVGSLILLSLVPRPLPHTTTTTNAFLCLKRNTAAHAHTHSPRLCSHRIAPNQICQKPISNESIYFQYTRARAYGPHGPIFAISKHSNIHNG